MEDLLKLESDHTLNSREVASKIQERLRGARDPSLLGELVDFYFKTYSKRARKILTTLREAHSQVFTVTTYAVTSWIVTFRALSYSRWWLERLILR